MYYQPAASTTVALPSASYTTHQLPHAMQPTKVYGQSYGGYCILVLWVVATDHFGVS
jgi:hypothetical protein